MAYDGFYAALSTRASVNELLNQALAAKEEIRILTESTLDELTIATRQAEEIRLEITQVGSQVQQAATNVGLAAGRAEQSAQTANGYAGQAMNNATQSLEALNETRAIRDEIGDTETKFEEIDEKFAYYDIRIAPIQQTDTSAMDEDVAVVGGGIQAEFKEKIRQPPVGIVAAYAARTLVAPTVNWDAGWTTGISNAVICEAGSKRINKVVVNYAQMDALNEGGAALLGYEFSLGGINPNGNFAASSDFFSPNLESVPNKHRVQRMAGYTNQDTGKVIQNYGPTVDKYFRELVPAEHPGYITGRWYTNPYYYAGTVGTAIPANTGWLKTVHIKARINMTKLRVYVGTQAGGQIRVGMYAAVQGRLGEAVYVSPIIASPAASTSADFTVNKQIEPGTYYIAVACSVAGLTFGDVRTFDGMSNQPDVHGMSDTELKEGNTNFFLLVPFPSLASMENANPNVAPNFSPQPKAQNGAEPRVYFQVGDIALPSYPGNGRPTNN